MQQNNKRRDQGKDEHEIQDNGYFGWEGRQEVAPMCLDAVLSKSYHLWWDEES